MEGGDNAEMPVNERNWRWVRVVLVWFCVLILIAVSYLASPIALFAVLRAKVIDLNSQEMMDALEVLYDPAERLSEEWKPYGVYIEWCKKVTKFDT